MILSRPPTFIFLLLLCLLFPQNLLSQNLVKKAHSHNDYLNNRPLFDALENKFKSIEVDIFFLNSKLYVGHNWLQLRKNKTIETLYLEPWGAEGARRNAFQQDGVLHVPGSGV